MIKKLDVQIPVDQTAYMSGRSKMENVFAAKLLVERAQTSSIYKIHFMQIDLLRAFDTADRSTLPRYLKRILNPD